MGENTKKTPEQLAKHCQEAYKSYPTDCSHAAWYVIKQYKSDQRYMQANELVDFLAKSSEWQQVHINELSGLASSGELVVGGLKEKGNGHVIVVYPGPEKTKGGYYYKDSKTKKNVKCDEKGSYARAMSGSIGSWPGAKSNGDKTVWDAWGNDAKFKTVRFWKYIGSKKDEKKEEKKEDKKKNNSNSGSKLEGARKNSEAKVICTVPDVCLKQIGNTVVPIPYPITATFGDSESTSDRVRFGGDAAFLLDQSTISKVKGDSSGDKKGIMSGTIEDKVEPKEGSSKFRIGGKSVVRHGDLCDMNNGNTQGKVVYAKTSPACKVDADGKPMADTNPPIQLTEKEQANSGVTSSPMLKVETRKA